jgi:hypothetical protein
MFVTTHFGFKEVSEKASNKAAMKRLLPVIKQWADNITYYLSAPRDLALRRAVLPERRYFLHSVADWARGKFDREFRVRLNTGHVLPRRGWGSPHGQAYRTGEVVPRRGLCLLRQTYSTDGTA